MGTQFLISQSGFQFHFCHSCDGSQRLTTETHGMQGKKIGSLTDLRSGMALKSESGIRLRHTLSIVYNLNAGTTSILHQHLHSGSPSINGVFHQLLYHRSWSLDDFTSSDLVGDGIR